MDIPAEIFSTYREFADDFINSNFGVNCRIYHKPKRIVCSCAGVTNNRYAHGGPASKFNRGCQYCGGDGFKEEQITENIKLRVYHERRNWIKVGNLDNLPDGVCQVIGFLTDLPAIKKCEYIVLNSAVENIQKQKYILYGEAHPHGFGRDRYFLAFMQRVV